MRIGVLGGSFDPPHLAHMELAKASILDLKLDEILWVPAQRNPLKTKASVASARQRLEMVKLATVDEPNMAVSDIEISRGGQSFTVDTITELQILRPGDYWFLIGSDSLRTFNDWKQPDRLLRLCRLGVAVRPPETEAILRGRLEPNMIATIDWIHMPTAETSSSEIRKRLGANHPVGTLLNPCVERYIREQKLYQI
jgi:nicotinate-nucleotide adenylyltransferase